MGCSAPTEERRKKVVDIRDAKAWKCPNVGHRNVTARKILAFCLCLGRPYFSVRPSVDLFRALPSNTYDDDRPDIYGIALILFRFSTCSGRSDEKSGPQASFSLKLEARSS